MTIGHDYIGVSAVALIHDGNGKFLLQKRGPKARDERGKWDLCAGAVEHGETIETTITREVAEELNALPLEIKFIGAGERLRAIDSVQVHWIWLLHAVLVDPKRIQIGEPDKIAEIHWFTSDTLPEPLHDNLMTALNLAREQNIIR